jgi:HTH-type transcriptional regulator, transcriptional repressor of NAD biosynthesis genes
MTPHGLIVGKFYPPHCGHHLLIHAAAANCELVTVLVMGANVESISMGQRVNWICDEHRSERNVRVISIADNIPVDYDDVAIWNQHEDLMRRALLSIDAPKVTAVFSSEAYGKELARRFDAIPVLLDVSRHWVPMSGTTMRADITAHWHYLAPATRAGLALRVVVLGAESTGTTTLSLALAARLRSRGGVWDLTRWVPEFGREYTLLKYSAQVATGQLDGMTPDHSHTISPAWRTEEFEHIAQSQLALEDVEARAGGPILICDTDAFATSIWHERYIGKSSPKVMAIADSRPHDLYLVTHHDGVQFTQDGIRDGESVRPWMTERFIEALIDTNRHYRILRGTHDSRMEQAMAAVDDLLVRSFHFNPPL